MHGVPTNAVLKCMEYQQMHGVARVSKRFIEYQTNAWSTNNQQLEYQQINGMPTNAVLISMEFLQMHGVPTVSNCQLIVGLSNGDHIQSIMLNRAYYTEIY